MRAFSLIEIVVVVAVSAVLAASAIALATTAAKRGRSAVEMERLLKDLASQRATHVAEGRDELVLICNDCVDSAGNENASGARGVVDFYLGDDVTDRKRGRLVGSFAYDLDVVFTCQRAALDALGRSIVLGRGDDLPALDGPAPLPGPCTIKLQGPDAPKPEQIVLGADGRISSTFAPTLLPEPPHARNLSSRFTPTPMDRGRFEGDRTRALALPLR